MNIKTFIFNWRGQYSNTIEKINQFKEIGITPIIINSDEEHEESEWVNIGEDSYFTAQFLKALELFDADILFHIQADATYNDWQSLINDAIKYYDKYEWGIYAPNVDYTWYDSTRTDIERLHLPDTNLKMVANTDCTCWFISKQLINLVKQREIDFSPYKMGWSFDIVYPAISYINKMPVIRDYKHTICHPKGTNYNTEQAEKEMHELYEELPDDVKEAFYYIKMNRDKLTKYYMD